MIKSIKTLNSYRKRAVCKCDSCGKEFTRPLVHAKRSLKNFCDKRCQYKYYKTDEAKKLYVGKSTCKVGKKNPMYGSTYTPEQKRELARSLFRRTHKSKKNYRLAADRLWSRIVLSAGKCAVCGSTNSLNPHHIVGRKNLTLRHDLRNGICLCAGCHIFRDKSAHQNPLWFVNWLKERRPEDLDYLSSKSSEITRRSLDDYEELVEDLRKKDPFYERKI